MSPFLFIALALFMLFVAFLSFRPGIVAKKYAFKECLNSAEGQKITDDYKRACLKTGIILACAAVPPVILSVTRYAYASFLFFYLFVWVVAWLYVFQFRLAPAYLSDLWRISHNNKKRQASDFIDAKTKVSTFLALIVTGGALMMMFYFEFSPLSVSSNGDTISINAAFYSRDFNKNDVKHAVLLNQPPPLNKKRDGFESAKCSYGHFEVEGMGDVEFYVNRLSPTCIMVELNDGKNIVFNTHTPEETARFFSLLHGN